MNLLSENEELAAGEVANRFGLALEGISPNYRIKQRPDGPYFILEVAEPTERFFALVERINAALDEDHLFRDRIAVQRRAAKPKNRLELPETQLLQKELSQSLTVDRDTFGEDFLKRYMPSVTGLESAIVVNANHVVFGRRGAGKSSLLAYSMHQLRARGMPLAWLAMQTYSGRTDEQAVASVLAALLEEVFANRTPPSEIGELRKTLLELSESTVRDVATKIDRLVPRYRRALAAVATATRPLTLFLDDLHVLGRALQPRLLAVLYSACRDNRAYIKASGIEQFTRLWDAKNQQGLQAPHDAQILKLDYNLTMPDRSKEHIVGILDAHAKYCGIPGVQYLANDAVISRLVLTAAAVPRDALSLFSQAATRSLVLGQKTVTITSVNAAASEAVEAKIQDVERDLFEDRDEVTQMLDAIKQFCVTDKRTNSFLVKIDNKSNVFRTIQSLVALRLVHVIHEGITPHKAGERYVALMLDFGFYVGIRAARSVRLFPDTPKALTAKELRKLPIYESKAQ